MLHGRDPWAGRLRRRDSGRSADDEREPGGRATQGVALCAVCEREAPDFGQVRDRVRTDDEEEDREARAVQRAEEVGVRAGDDESDAACEQGERGADDDRRDAC